MIVQCLKSLEERLKQYVHLMEAESGLNHGFVNHIGSHLADLTEKANKVFGGIIFVDMVTNAMNTTCSVFILFGLLGIYGDKITPSRGLFSIAFIAYSAFFITKMRDLQKCGQSITSAYSDIRWEPSHIKMENQCSNQ